MGSVFQVDGLISGLNTSDIISQLMAIERQPLTVLQKQQSTLQQRTDALKDVATRLSSLQAALDKLRLSSTFSARTVSTDTPSGSPAVVSATASADAALGSFKVTVSSLATSTVAASAAALGLPVDETAALASAGFRLTPTTGFFTINGTRITIDANTTLNSGPNSVVSLINTSAAGVTASVQSNRLVLTSNTPGQQIQLGSGADTSNFLAAAQVLAAPQTLVNGSYQVMSTGGLGVTQVGSTLANARLATALDASGKFTVNGVEFSYDAQADSLSGIISRINASSAGVNAAYDAQNDRLVLTAKATGSVGISLQDVQGNFLAATGLADSAAQTLGQNAVFSVDTGTGAQTLYSTTNTIQGAIPGVTLTLKSTSATPVTVTVQQDTAPALSAVKAFVDQYNSTIGFIRDATAYNPDAKTGGLLLGDSGVQSIEPRLRELLFSPVAGASGGITNLADVGITTGAIGSKPGTTDTLTLDEAKFTAALQDNPAAVARLFAPTQPSVTLQGGGTGSIASAALVAGGSPSLGTYVVTSDASGNLSSVFTPVGGSALPAVIGTISAGGTNSTLISGIVLQGRNPLAAGTDTISVTAGDGVAIRLGSYLDSLIGTNGTLTTRRSSEQDDIRRLGQRIADQEDRLTEKEQSLVQRFAALESALATLQAQSAQIAGSLAGLTSQRSS